jgi:hypothetical protein
LDQAIFGVGNIGGGVRTPLGARHLRDAVTGKPAAGPIMRASLAARLSSQTCLDLRRRICHPVAMEHLI